MQCFFFYPIPIHSKHSLIALASTASASPRIIPKPTMATPTISKATCATGFIALNNLTTLLSFRDPLDHTDYKIRVKRE